MKSLKLLILILSVFQITGCRDTAVPEKLVSQVDSLSAAFVPVNGEGLCDIGLYMSDGGLLVIKGETNLPAAKDELIALMERSGHAFSDSIRVLPDTTKVKKPWGLVTLSVCNMRGRPAHAGEMVTQAIMGTPVRILDRRGGWFFIQTPDSYLGWTNDAAIAELTQSEMDAWRGSGRVIYTRNIGDLKGDDGGVVTDLVMGSVLKKEGETGDRYIVSLPDGRRGILSKSDAADFSLWASEKQPVAGELIAFGKSLLGSPYLWGGTSTKGIDCSGFVKITYFTAGMILARDASSQYLYGREIPMETSLDSLLPGDLVFFGHMRDGKKWMGHTGMYIGDTEVIHSSGMVKINSLDTTRANYSEYLGSIFLGAKRFIGVPPEKGYQRVAEHNWYF